MTVPDITATPKVLAGFFGVKYGLSEHSHQSPGLVAFALVSRVTRREIRMSALGIATIENLYIEDTWRT